MQQNISPSCLTQSILDNFGGLQNSSFTFNSPLVNTSRHDDFEPDFDSLSCYYTTDQFLDSFKTANNQFTIFDLNVQSIHAKIEEIRLFLHTLSNDNFYFDALCFQETWLSENDNTSLIEIDGYNLIHQGKSCSTHAGLAIYIRNIHSYDHYLSETNSAVWEALFVKVNVNSSNKQVIIGNAYRPPNNQRDSLTAFFESFTTSLGCKTKLISR